MKRSPEELEKLIHRTLRSLPERTAPRSLEGRVLAAIDARASLPWWRRSYAQWPLIMRCAFLLLSGGLVKLALMGAVWAMARINGTEFAEAFTTQFAWIDAAGATVRGSIGYLTTLIRSIPAYWLYTGLGGLAALYLLLFGLGATAYRALYADR
jgi:hypothetical protein